MTTVSDPMQTYASGILPQSSATLAPQADGRYALVIHAADGQYARLLLPADAVTAELRVHLSGGQLRVAWSLESPP